MTRTGFWVRLGLSIAIDLLDFTIGRMLIPIPWEEGVGALILTLLWGPAGLLYLAELADFTEFIDAFIPTATLIALFVGWRRGFLWSAGLQARTARAPAAGNARLKARAPRDHA